MSEGARIAWGLTENLVETITGDIDGAPITTEISFARFWKAGGRVLVAGRRGESSRSPEELFRVQGKFLRDCERLRAAERRLSRRVEQRSKGKPVNLLLQLEGERQRVSRELHTNVGQLLAAIRLQLELLTIELPDCGPAVNERVEKIGDLNSQALDQVRNISQQLHPPLWQKLRIEDALRQLWELSGIPQRFQARFTIAPLPEEPPLDARIVLYRAAQEAMSNVIRHARASQVNAWLEHDPNQLVLRFEDDGAGFDTARLSAAGASLSAGIGLRTIREQAESLKGTLEVESSPQGTRLLLTLPRRIIQAKKRIQKLSVRK